MNTIRFKKFFEATDIFGFEHKPETDSANDDMISKPIVQFDVELMMNLLSNKSVGMLEVFQPFVSEIQWGVQPGALKLEVDTGYTFYIKQLGTDKEGHKRWITRKMFQLNRQGYGGLEDSVADEIHDHILNIHDGMIPAPAEGVYNGLEDLAIHVYNKMKRCAKNIFIPVGIKKQHEHVYILSFEVRGHGLEAQDQRRIEQNQTVISYDENQGSIRIFNYNIESPTGRTRKWEIMENDLDLYFFPTQDRDEIGECLAVHFKYY